MAELLPALRATGFSDRALIAWLNGCLHTCARRGPPYREVREVLTRCLSALGADFDPERAPLDVMGRAKAASKLMNRCLLTVRGATRAAEHDDARAHEDALLIGALREDVAVVPATTWVYEHPSLDHAYREGEDAGFIKHLSVGAVRRCEHLYQSAQALYTEQGPAAGYAELGRVLHILGDLYVPVHAHAVAHSTDGYEWMIEARFRALLALPVVECEPVDSAADCVRKIARFTRGFEPDRSNHPLKRWSSRLRAIPRVPLSTLWSQASEIVPVALAHSARLLDLFHDELHQTQARGQLELESAAHRV